MLASSFLRLVLSPLLVTLLLASCTKKEEPTPPPTPALGSISGQVTPATSVALVTATRVGGQPVTAVPNAAGGFSISSLPAGDYTLAFAVAAGYVAPANSTVSLAAGQNLIAPAVTIIDAKTAWLTARSWRVSSYTVQRVSTSPINPYLFTDVFAQMAACERDNFFRFALPAVLTKDEGASKCSPADPQTVSDSWSFDANKTRLLLPYASNPSNGFEILTFDANTISLRNVDSSIPSITFTTNITLTSF